MLTGQRALLVDSDPLPPDGDVPPAAVDHDPLFREARPRLFGLLRRRGYRGDATDLVQQVFVRFLGLGQGHRARIEAPVAYLQRTALNLATDEARARFRHQDAQHVPAHEIELLAPDQVAALEARDMLRRIEDALALLKPRTREIFLAHRIDGFSYVEIAARTGLSVKGVEKHMSRAIAHIDRVLSAR